MNRRAFMTGLGAMLATPAAPGAEQQGKIPRRTLVVGSWPRRASARGGQYSDGLLSVS